MRKGWLLLLLLALAGCGQVVYAVGPANWSNLPGTPPTNVTDTPGAGASAPTVDVAAKTKRLCQCDASIGWDSADQYNAEWRAACGPTSLTVVLRAWGVQIGVGKMLDLLRDAGAYDNGIVSLENFANVIPDDQRNFPQLDSTYYYHLTDAHLRAMTQAGYAVLVNLWDPDGRFYPFQPGHWLVVTNAGDPQGVWVRDSSTLDISRMSWAAFDYEFTHRAVLLHRKGVVLP
ncbi:MAG TPA: hypothetical protein VKT82_15615 [Ktedonobacterales bacterium]|nr:hypothetical protein [Ktedonobacterales bacterium]